MAQSVVEEQQEESLHHNLRNILAKLNINTVEEFFGLDKKPKSSQATHSLTQNNYNLRLCTLLQKSGDGSL
ncbi:hypothetical protein PGT21_025939 [Puccinia graminis f. sp. tritici]|uniref:Uncharacterized protein n=1 Tax=Puccinia graminis f. sp. tritici TaxID=56615 RepID=A0A5B0NWU6_PUCGR|nr:hypothetical protein PGT21_025939 [Puccinia graminis f. sp. tritici]KAA1135015.1 hypothetical protein PGTUg99_007823 [Puccinia graminis f. sp. tritici]